MGGRDGASIDSCRLIALPEAMAILGVDPCGTPHRSLKDPDYWACC